MTTATKVEGVTDARAAGAAGARPNDAAGARPPRKASALRARGRASARGGGLLRIYAPAGAAYVLLTWLTDAWFMGDTSGYVDAVLAYDGGALDPHTFWEFGHLLWRPLGWLAYRATAPLSEAAVGPYPRAQAALALVWLGWAAGLAAVLLFAAAARRAAGGRAWAALAAALGFTCGNAFLNYAQTGCSYVPGLALLVAAVYFMMRREGDAASSPSSPPLSSTLPPTTSAASLTPASPSSPSSSPSLLSSSEPPYSSPPSGRDAVLAGAALAGAICLWFPYALMVPGVLAVPLALRGFHRRRLRAAALAALSCGLIVAAAYASVVALLGIGTPGEFLAWVTAASHGYRQAGLPRLLFGLARSFIHTGQDGLLLKRYMLGDPLSPVSTAELFRLSLWKLGLFYAALAALAYGLLRAAGGRRWLLLLVLHAAPVVFFALFVFEAGMPERYLPLYPFAFLSLACALGAGHGSPAWARGLLLLFVAATCVSDAWAMRAGEAARQQGAVVARLGELQPRLGAGSMVAVTHFQDDVAAFYLNYPFHPLNRAGALAIYAVTEPGAARTRTWREDFAAQSLKCWGRGGEVWLSERLLAERPRPEWNWAEGGDPHARWRDLPPFFARFDLGERLGGDDGFALLARTPRNEEALRELARGASDWAK